MISTLMALVGGGKWIDVLPKSNSIAWGSSADALAVDLTFNCLTDLVVGTHIVLNIDNQIAFTGMVIKRSKDKNQFTFTCFDYSFYLNSNEAIIQFNKVTADVAIKDLCTRFGVKCNVVKINYIVEDTVTTTISNTATVTGSSVIAIAKKYLGVKYVYGGTTPSGFDCSGFTEYVFKQMGVEITRTTYTQVKQGTVVAEKSLRAGDLVFFGSKTLPHHVAIYMGDGNVIQAPQTGEVVKITPLKYFTDYATARRITIPKTKSSSSTTTIGGQATYAGGYHNGLYKSPINTYAKQNGESANLIAGIIEVESTYDKNAGKGGSHVGLGQMDYASAVQVGLINSSGDHRLESTPSIEAICKLLLVKYKATGTLKKAIMAYGENTTAYYNKVVAATPGHNIGTITSSVTGSVSVTKDVADTTIISYVSKIYKDQTLSAIIDDILANATLALGTVYIKEMISDILYIRTRSEYKVFPTFLLADDIVVNSSIEEMRNKVIATSNDDASIKVLTLVDDPVNIKIYGSLQEVLTLDTAYDIAHAKNVATSFLKLNNKIFMDATLNIVVISGGAELRANRFIGLAIDSMGLNGWYNIKSISNTLDNEQLKASLTLEW